MPAAWRLLPNCGLSDGSPFPARRVEAMAKHMETLTFGNIRQGVVYNRDWWLETFQRYYIDDIDAMIISILTPFKINLLYHCKFSIAIWEWMLPFPDMMSFQSMFVGNICWLLINRAILDLTSRIWTWPPDSKLGRLKNVQSSAGAKKNRKKRGGPFLNQNDRRWHRYSASWNTWILMVPKTRTMSWSDFSSCNVCVSKPDFHEDAVGW